MNRRFMSLWSNLRLQQAAIQSALQQQPSASSSDEPAPPEPARTLGLALGGGGGKGGAHLGVLAVLEELGLPIDAIAGTSVGGFVGIMYAAGFRLHEIADLFRSFALRRVAVTDPTRTGFVGSRKREALLIELLGDRTFADLPIPCAVTATDLASGRLVVIEQGPLVPALMATTALPGIFPPQLRDHEVLADGGVLNNLPVDVAEQLGARRVIAVQLGAASLDLSLPVSLPANPLARLMLAPRQFALASRAVDLMIAELTELRLAQSPPALLLNPQVSRISTLDMSRAEEGYRAGEASARAATAELLALRAWRLAPQEHAPTSHRAEPRPRVGSQV